MSITPDLMYRLLVRNVTDYAIYMLDIDGTVLNWNAGAQRAKGYSASEIVGRNYELFYSQEDRAAGVPGANLEIARRDGGLRLEGWRFRKDGTRFWAMITIDPVYDDEGVFVGFAKVTRDLTEKYQMMARIEHQATHDALTGILNRGGLLTQLGAELADGRPTAIHCIDLDGFKPVNDRHGHMAGDDALKAVAERLERTLDGLGFVGRIGGDEFVAVQSSTSDRREASDLAERLGNDLERPISIASTSIRLGASIGSSLSPDDGMDVGTLLLSADRALYAAKHRRAGERSAVSRTMQAF